MAHGAPTVAMFPEPGAWGPTNNLVAIAQPLRERGIRVVFVVEESFAGELERRGFEEALMRIGPPPERPEDVGEGWAQFVRDTAPEFRRPTLEQLATVTAPIWSELAGGARYAHERLMEIWEEIDPDLIVIDCVAAFPAVPAAGVPWVRIVSANPLELSDPELPPVFSGYPLADRRGWAEFRAEYRRRHDPLIAELSELGRRAGAGPLPDGEFQYVSPWLNLYLFPDELDYPRSRPLGSGWQRIESSVRAPDEPFALDERLPGDGPVVYLSLGSLGCMDISLMQRVIDLLDRSGHRAIVSLGPLHEQLTLGERMYGERFLPQTAVLPQCDLVITHGGNNTIGEAFHFGLPTIVLPLFWDQYDNAQRVQETGFGRRLATYAFADEELPGAIDELLGDRALHERLRAIASRLQATPGRERAAELIESVLRS